MATQPKVKSPKIKAADFEDKVWAIEGVRIVLRVDQNTLVEDYSYKKAADESWRIKELIDKRIEKCVGATPIVVVQGDGEEPHGRVILRTLRTGYKP
ncbi:hypothetical protein NYR95_19885 [Xanthomonas dyei]|uniref:ParB/Sulfiredoxin domain-containing protein n=1 Tax=Xanthomonas dyei TaxID=743699 RepID=A0ABZ0DCX1_9XANT|nr:hypothetical protein [Xanthomonas dyei]WOB25909.1 hypothetical protein NYR99_19880 [Xanthomonas dyei]WOB53532.1 hypothetical protein NYR95_19885 [Xanthomonas dyei]